MIRDALAYARRLPEEFGNMDAATREKILFIIGAILVAWALLFELERETEKDREASRDVDS